MKLGSDVVGERTIAEMQARRPLAVRFKRGVAVAIMAILGGGLLAWYYMRLASATTAAADSPAAAVRSALLSEMKLPTIHIGTAADSGRPDQKGADGESGTGGDTPAAHGRAAPHTENDAPADGGGPYRALAMLDTGRAAPVFARPLPPPTAGGDVTAAELTAVLPNMELARDTAAGTSDGRSNIESHAGGAAVAVGRLATLRWLIPKGTFLDCTLETAIDSTLSGLVTCILARDVYGADGRIVLLERGTKLVGESRNDTRPGQARIAVIWTEARTPAGIIATLASPGTDELGGAGTPGVVDRHVRERFGAAMLISMVDAAVSAASLRQQGSGAVIYNTQGSRDVATEVLRNTVSISPTIRVAAGTRVMVTVVRDIDFRGVYRLVAHDDR